ncbi:MAG: MotA/TolQ/ExbB proton channel family protein [Deltaproteobacteria bacterium]|nr:MotA/TolQ/ExbB proton channel family protein [Deltaproteobacteria bacterium]
MTARCLAMVLTLIALGMAAVPPAAADENDLVQAYKKEFAFLESEKASLAQRLAEHDAQAQAKLDEARADVGKEQNRVRALSARADKLAEQLQDFDRQIESVLDAADSLDATVSQAATTLASHGETPADATGEGGARVRWIYDAGLSVLRRVNSVRTEDGEFFRVDGSKGRGTIVRVGQIAAVAAGDGAAGTLAPAGDKRFKIWPDGDEGAARALATGGRPDVLPLFLFDSLDKSAEQAAEQTVLEHVASGGVIAWIIVAIGLAALIMIVLRANFLQRSGMNTEQLVSRVNPLMDAGKKDEALSLCHASKGATARVLQATLRNIDRDRDHLEDIISESIMHETPFLDRFGTTIMVCAAVAPLLGLLGTVTGMISTFEVITEFGTGDPKMLSGGISEALVTTELGLMVAIPALLCGNLLAGWAEKIKAGMESAALGVTNRSARRGGAKGNADVLPDRLTNSRCT